MPMPNKISSKRPGEWKVSVRRSYAGLGLFAEEEIPKGARIIEYFGRTLENA